MTKRYSSKKYSDYPVIVDNNDNTELTLDSVVKLLNEHEFWDKHDTKEHNKLHKQINYIVDKKDKINTKYNRLKQILIVLLIIICIETYIIFL